jgi:2,6-dihydroxypseudooxynicotine hydrolase
LLGGLESTKEEGYLFENLCLRRGLATVAFDGPGQGETRSSVGIVPDFNRYTSTVLDYLEDRADIDSSRIGVLGRSLGGHYAIRSAALDHRLKACVCWGGSWDLSFYDIETDIDKLGWAYASGLGGGDKQVKDYVQNAINLDGLEGLLTAPIYVLHGGTDSMPATQVELISAAFPAAPKDVVIEPTGGHCCHNLSQIVRPRMADWLARQLL